MTVAMETCISSAPVHPMFLMQRFLPPETRLSGRDFFSEPIFGQRWSLGDAGAACAFCNPASVDASSERAALPRRGLLGL